jgi:carbamoyltransferase
MTAILGLSAFYHDSAATLLVDGEIVAAAQEERFTRCKHDERFPQRAVTYCLQQAGLTPGDLDYVGFYEKPLLKLDRLLETYLAWVPAGYASFRRAVPAWLNEKLHLPRIIRQYLPGYSRRIVFAAHHESHAASAFFPSPFEEAAILTLDGVGEWSTTCIGSGRGNRLQLHQQLRFPHSLGLLYSAFTYYTGFKVNSGEYKLMGLAPYGTPKYRQLILDHLLDLKADGSFRLDMRYFNYCQGLNMTSEKFHHLFGGPPRLASAPLTEREMDLAASIQSVTEEVLLRTVRHAHALTGQKHLAMAGGVALNCVANGRILREGPFEQVWIQPAAGDAGGSLGVAQFIWHQLLGQPRDPPTVGDGQSGSFLGPGWSDDEIAALLSSLGGVATRIESAEVLCSRVAQLLAEGAVVGWFQGRMEFGPRALGGRSILGDPRRPDMQSTMNLKIKFRESFRPFAPMVLREHVHEYFELPPETDSPYMLLVAPVRTELRTAVDPAAEPLFGIDLLKQPRSIIPAVTHVDYSARVQTVDPLRHPLTSLLLQKFQERTGIPVLINTSFNVRSEPMVCTPEDAYRCFLMTDLDVLVLGQHILLKVDQPALPDHLARARYLEQFTPD